MHADLPISLKMRSKSAVLTSTYDMCCLKMKIPLKVLTPKWNEIAMRLLNRPSLIFKHLHQTLSNQVTPITTKKSQQHSN